MVVKRSTSGYGGEGLLLSFEGKINRKGCATLNLDRLFSHSKTFMPDAELVCSRRNFADFKISRFIRDGKIGMLEHMEGADHEGMGIASGIEKSRH